MPALATQGSNAPATARRIRGDAAPAHLQALERNKVVAINPRRGSKFDPHHHQAISVVPAQQEANTIVTVLQKGLCDF